MTNAARKADAMSWSQTMNNYSRPRSIANLKLDSTQTPTIPGGVAINLHNNDYIIEQLSVLPLASLNEHFDLVIGRKYLIAKEPEWHVLYRSTLHLQDLKNLQSVLDQLLLWEA